MRTFSLSRLLIPIITAYSVDRYTTKTEKIDGGGGDDDGCQKSL